MELAQLRYFEAVVEHGSLTAAARALGVSQPTLTVAMRKLEARYRTTLLLRDRRGVTPTDTGLALLRHAREVFEVLRRAEDRILGLEGEEMGSFVVGCYESLGAYFLPHFMPSFLSAHPRIELTLWNGPSAEVQRQVVRRAVDFGVVVNPLPHPDLVLVELFRDAVDFFAVPQAGDGAGLEEAKARLRRGPLLFAGRVLQSAQLQEVLVDEGLLPGRLLPCGDLHLVKSLVLSGLGVGILPRRVASYGHDGQLQRLHPELPHIPDTIMLVYRADMHRTRAAMRVKDALVVSGQAMMALEDVCSWCGAPEVQARLRLP